MGYKLGQSSPTASGMIDFVNKTQAEKYAEFDAKIAEQQKAAGECLAPPCSAPTCTPRAARPSNAVASPGIVMMVVTWRWPCADVA